MKVFKNKNSFRGLSQKGIKLFELAPLIDRKMRRILWDMKK